MRFHYIAFQPDGKMTEGDIDASDQMEVLNFLVRRKLQPVSVQSAELELPEQSKKFFGQKITITDKMFLTRYLALMLKVGTDLFKAIDILIADFDKPIIKALLLEVRVGLEKGQPFHSTFERYPEFFSPVFVNLIKAGEASGNLDQVFADLSLSLEKEGDLKSRIKSALVYPAMLLVMAVIILTFLVTFALPKIAAVFSGSGVEPPTFSRIVFGVGLFLGEYIWYFLGFGSLLIIGSAYFFFKTTSGKAFLQRALNVTPVVKTLINKIAMRRFTGTMSSLLRAGLRIVESLEITADATGKGEISESLHRVAEEGIKQGLTIGDAFRREAAFPRVVVNLIAISEKAGHLDEILKTLSDFYDTEIDRSLKTLVSFVEPALLLLIGVVVAVIALSIIIPIYQLVGQF